MLVERPVLLRWWQRRSATFKSLSPLVKGVVVGLMGLAVLQGCSPSTAPDKSASAVHGAAVPPKEPQVGLEKSRLRLISQAQYINTITNIFGSDVLPEFTFAPFQRTEGLITIGAAYQGVSSSQVATTQRIAEVAAARVVAPERRAYFIPCTPANEKAADKACATKFLSYVGKRLFRRPLTQAKLDEVVTKAGEGAERLGDFYAGISLAVEGLLLSPNTLFIEEVLEPDPQNPGRERLDAYSLASRLSFFLWNMAPDDALLKAAASGELDNPKGRARVVDAMLASPKLETGVRAFFDDMLGFDDFANLAKDSKIYPAFTGQAVIEAREQTLRTIVDQLLTQNGDYRDLFTTRKTFVAPSLATLYRTRATTTWVPYTIPADSPQVGLLTQIAFLSLHSHPGRSSPTLRGKALRELLMCQPVPRPPANVDFSALENPDPSLRTMRDRLDAHRKNPVCAGCHKITDPMGLALENFDASGQYRTDEKGATIDASGTLDGKEFKDAAGLGQAMHDSPVVPACLVKRIYTYARGGKLPATEQPLVNYFNERFAGEGYRLRGLMREIALSTSFSAIDRNMQSVPVKTARVSSPTETTTRANQ